MYYFQDFHNSFLKGNGAILLFRHYKLVGYELTAFATIIGPLLLVYYILDRAALHDLGNMVSFHNRHLHSILQQLNYPSPRFFLYYICSAVYYMVVCLYVCVYVRILCVCLYVFMFVCLSVFLLCFCCCFYLF